VFTLLRTREAGGAEARTEEFVLQIAHAIGHLEHEGKWVDSGLARAACRHGRGVVWVPDTCMITGWVGGGLLHGSCKVLKGYAMLLFVLPSTRGQKRTVVQYPSDQRERETLEQAIRGISELEFG
jgi:hypothetical protein